MTGHFGDDLSRQDCTFT